MAISNTKRRTIKLPFVSKEEFMNKITIFLFQIGYTQDFKSDNFFSYKPSFEGGILAGRINITINQNEAIIDGPKINMLKLEKFKV